MPAELKPVLKEKPHAHWTLCYPFRELNYVNSFGVGVIREHSVVNWRIGKRLGVCFDIGEVIYMSWIVGNGADAINR